MNRKITIASITCIASTIGLVALWSLHGNGDSSIIEEPAQLSDINSQGNRTSAEHIDIESNRNAETSASSNSMSDISSGPAIEYAMSLPDETVLYIAEVFSGVVDAEDFFSRFDSALSKPLQSLSVDEALGLAEFSSKCDAAMTDGEYDEFIISMEQTLLEMGEGNGSIQNMIETTTLRHEICKKMSGREVKYTTHDFYNRAASLGDARSKFSVATAYPPPNLIDLPEKEKQVYLKAAGSMLIDARNSCEPSAFTALAMASNFGEGETWIDPSGESPVERSYSNLIALREYSSRYGTGEFSRLKIYASKLGKNLTSDQKQKLESKGIEVFARSCGQ